MYDTTCLLHHARVRGQTLLRYIHALDIIKVCKDSCRDATAYSTVDGLLWLVLFMYWVNYPFSLNLVS